MAIVMVSIYSLWITSIIGAAVIAHSCKEQSNGKPDGSQTIVKIELLENKDR